MHPPDADTVLVRHGEIGVKSEQVKRKMETRLRDNLVAMLADREVSGEVEYERTRLFVHTDPESIEAATDAAAATFGVVSASPATVTEATKDAILDALGETARVRYDGGSFAVRARRAGNPEDHPFSSADLEREGGARVWSVAEEAGLDPAVDLEDPDRTFFVECRESRAYVFLEKRPGPGGLPLGTQRPLIALISGGIDSPVAAWEVMKRGVSVIPLYVDLGEYGGVDHRLRAEATVDRLFDYAPQEEPILRVAPGGPGVERLVAEMDGLRMLSFRRFMYRIAEHVAERLGAVGVVTGEAIGQKSSQTVANLRVTSVATDLPIHRPLIGRDKSTITERARDIGTFEDATIAAGCNRVAPSFPETNASLDEVEAAEPDDLFDLAAEAAAEVTETHLER